MKKMIFRIAKIEDIAQIQVVRNSVKENVLSNPALITDSDCADFLTKRGKGWVCEVNNEIVGFSIVDLVDNNIWGLFVTPEFEQKGIGKKLHHLMLDFYFETKKETVWLGTEPGTRAEKFYTAQGWLAVGFHGKGEVKFEMSFENWINLKRQK